MHASGNNNNTIILKFEVSNLERLVVCSECNTRNILEPNWKPTAYQIYKKKTFDFSLSIIVIFQQ